MLIAAGAGGGLAAAFNAPLAGLVSVLEEIQKNFAPGVFSTTFLACVCADAVSRLLFGQTAVFHTAPLAALPLSLVLGVATGEEVDGALMVELDVFPEAQTAIGDLRVGLGIDHPGSH